MKNKDSLIVKLYGNIVGYISLDKSDNTIFEYENDFKKLNIEISPIKLPILTTTIYQNGEDRFFEGLAGVFFDSLPDNFGNKIIKQYYENKGISQTSLTPIQKLAYIGTTGMGALEYIPNEQIDIIKESLEIKNLVNEARKVINGDIKVTIPELISSGGSVGGARAKAVIQWNKKTNDIISGRLENKKDYEQYIIKFDGINEDNKLQNYTKIEYIYMSIAKEIGLNVADVELIDERDFSHLLVKRFDRNLENKVHMHSLCGLTHTNFNIPGLFSYEDYLRVVDFITKDKQEIFEAFLHMVFNVITRNQDDHTKNFSFLMDESGIWKNSPAYDLTYSNGNGYTSQHQMSINSKRDNFTFDDILSISRKFDIGSDKVVKKLILDIKEIFIAKFKEISKKLFIDLKKVEKILNNLRF